MDDDTDMYFGKLPNEVICKIILRLAMGDILRCRLVSMRFNLIIQNSTAIQYKIELTANWFTACPGSTLSAATSIRMLMEQQEAWRSGEWRAEQVIRWETAGGRFCYAFRNGIWAFGHSDLPVYPILGYISATDIACIKLQSAFQGKTTEEPKYQWSLDNDDLDGLIFRDFTMDPLVNLLVLVEETDSHSAPPTLQDRIHFHSLTDGRPHEMATTPVIDLELDAHPVPCKFKVRLHGSYIGILVNQFRSGSDTYSDSPDSIVVWNWCTGEKECQIQGKASGFADFAFIDTGLWVQVNTPANFLEVWRFEASKSFFVGSFGFPILKPWQSYFDIHFDGGPSGSLVPASAWDRAPFSLSPISNVLGISFKTISMNHLRYLGHFTVVMQPQLMLEALEKRPPETNIEWEAWGPQCTRWIPMNNDHFKAEPCVAGGRFAVVTPADLLGTAEPANPAPQVVRLYDFMPERVARYARKFPQETCTAPSVIPKGAVFESDVITTLPYHVVASKELPQRVSAVMIDEGQLVFVKVKATFLKL
ncbi:hypothetical protein JB92DRAFT_3114108 [Gautieria morchelliformis]|nr:hypothetical protein JB92DRAFT_3114108 [Gautieria morchelliformis]